MKRIVTALIATFVVGWAFLAEAHEAKVILYPTIGPVSVPGFGIVSPSFSAYATNTLHGLWRGWPNAGGSIFFTPTAFNTIGDRISNGFGQVTVSARDMWATKDKSWRGLTHPHGLFAKERGTHYRTAAAITSYTPFTLADVILTATYSEDPKNPVIVPLGGPLDGPKRGLCQSFNSCQSCRSANSCQSFNSERLRGISWGRDGRPGGGDDIAYGVNNPGSYATPVNQLLFVGQGEWGLSDPDDPRSDKKQFADDFLAVIEDVHPHPYTFTHTYTLRSVSSTVKVTVIPFGPGGSRTGHQRKPHFKFRDH
jgi:hypothetical protein